MPSEERLARIDIVGPPGVEMVDIVAAVIGTFSSRGHGVAIVDDPGDVDDEPCVRLSVHRKSSELCVDDDSRAESLVGRRLYRWHGLTNPDKGEAVEVVAEGPEDLVLRYPNGRLELVLRSLIGGGLFYSELNLELSVMGRAGRNEYLGRENYEAMVAARKAAAKP